jgi:Asp-tRNA(Asn)/Glu-tRNA(Gln) amidotransferase A subunit family amidase
LAAASDLPDGPFRGVPILFKDLGCLVAGEVTAFGLGPLCDLAWPVTSYLAEQFRAAGFVPLGRTNVPEFGTTVTTESRSSAGAPPPELGWFTAEGSQLEGRRIASFIPYTAQFNMTGQPAVSLPLYWAPGGLPIGVQLVAAYGREDVLIQVASQLERAAPWGDRRPRVHA